jgi:DNA primase
VEPSAQELSAIETVSSNRPTTSAPSVSSAREHAAPATELLLAQLIVRYGEKIICEAEDAEGNAVPLSVTEFIFYSLTQDGLAFAQPLAQVVLDKAMKHVHDEGFVAEKYFLSHRNQQLSQAAFQLCMDKEELSKYHSRDQQLVPDSSRLLELTTHVLADMKLSIVRQKINNVRAEMKNPAMKSQQRELLVRFKELKDAESRLAKECGDRVLK